MEISAHRYPLRTDIIHEVERWFSATLQPRVLLSRVLCSQRGNAPLRLLRTARGGASGNLCKLTRDRPAPEISCTVRDTSLVLWPDFSPANITTRFQCSPPQQVTGVISRLSFFHSRQSPSSMGAEANRGAGNW